MSLKRNMGSFLQHGILCMLTLCAVIGAVTGDTGYYIKDSRTKIPELKKIECDNYTMHIVQINGVPFCECVDNGHYLVLAEYGDAICVPLDCSKISQHMNLVTKDVGQQECRCEDGYYMHQRNVHDPDTGRCTRCTNCSTTDKPYEAMPCYKSSDTLCCSSPDMIAQEVSLGFYDCVQPKTRPTTTATTTTTSTTKAPPNTQQSLDNTNTKEKYDVIIPGCNGPRMNVRVNKDGSIVCGCEDKSPAKKEGKEFVCDGQEESKNDDIIYRYRFLAAPVSFSAGFFLYVCASLLWKGFLRCHTRCQRYRSKLHKKREYSLARSHSPHSPETSDDETSV